MPLPTKGGWCLTGTYHVPCLPNTSLEHWTQVHLPRGVVPYWNNALPSLYSGLLPLVTLLFLVLPCACHKWPILPTLPEQFRLAHYHNYLWLILSTNHFFFFVIFQHNLCNLSTQSAILEIYRGGLHWWVKFYLNVSSILLHMRNGLNLSWNVDICF